MAMLRLAGFAGMWPSLDSRFLPDNAAQDVTNLQIDASGILRGMLGTTVIKTVSSLTRFVYRIPLAGPNTLANSYWWEHGDENTDVVRSPITNDVHERYYWANPSTGLHFATKAQILAGVPGGMTIGIIGPTTAPTVEAIVGTGEIVDGENVAPKVTRAYLVTFINEYGEESAPGPAFEVTGFDDQDYLVSAIPQPGGVGSYATFSYIRIYRSVTTATGDTDFYKVDDVAVGTLSYTDIKSDAEVGGSTALETEGWSNPPSDLQGIVAMPNGIFAGWKGNTLYFSENYRPHSWPDTYRITVEYPIVGLAVLQDSLIVATTGRPAVVTGSKAAMMSFSQNMAPMPCMSRRSIVSGPEGVFWASEDGLAAVTPAGLGVVTFDLINRDTWRNEFLPERQRAIYQGGIYTAFRNVVGEGDDIFMFAPSAQSKTGVVKGDLGMQIWGIGIEPWTNKAWVITGSGGGSLELREWKDVVAVRLPYNWKSKRFSLPFPVNFKVMTVIMDNANLPTDTLTITARCRLRGQAGDVFKTVWTRTITRSGREMKLPDGFKSDLWEFEFTGTAAVQEFQIANSVAELKSA